VSDELTPGQRYGDRYEEEGSGAGSGRSELATALRELAQDHEAPVAVPGAEIRRRAVHRRRRRTASLAAMGTAGVGALAVVLAVVLTGGEDARSTPPAASYGAQSPSATAEPSAAPAATVDLTRRELIAQGRSVPISTGTVKRPTPTGLMTVAAKYKTTTVPGDVAGWSEYEVKATWVMRLRGPDDRTNYLLALGWNEKAPGNVDITGGAIGLRSVDAMWLYEALRPGSVVEVVGAPTLSSTEGVVPPSGEPTGGGTPTMEPPTGEPVPPRTADRAPSQAGEATPSRADRADPTESGSNGP